MTSTVQKIAAEVKSLPAQELKEFLAWLADFEAAQPDSWDQKIGRDALPGGRLDILLNKVRDDIMAGKTRSLDEVIDHS